jgi:foldase protein PrsA
MASRNVMPYILREESVMFLKRGKTVVVAVTALVMILLAGCGSTSDSTVAEVNGEKITRDQLEAFMNVNRLFDPSMEQMMGSSEGRTVLEQHFLEQLVQSTLLKELAAEQDIEISAEESEQFFEHIKLQLVMMLGSEEELKAQMQELKITESDFMAPINSMLMQDALIERYASGIPEDEVNGYTEAASDTGVTLEISHILVASEEEAMQARERIASGDEFTDVAREISSCRSSKDGGALGSIPADTTQYDQDFMAGAKALTVDELSEPVKTQFGWHLIVVTNRSEADLDQVRQLLATQKLGEAFEALRERSDIKNNLL